VPCVNPVGSSPSAQLVWAQKLCNVVSAPLAVILNIVPALSAPPNWVVP
jgi:hypothetical protein